MGSRRSNYQLLLKDTPAEGTVSFHYREIAGKHVLLTKVGRSLSCHRYNGASKLWENVWKRDNLLGAGVENRRDVAFVNRDGWILVRDTEGVQVFRLDVQTLSLQHMATDSRYHEQYGWLKRSMVLLIGNFFADTSKIGVLSRNQRGAVKVEGVAKLEQPNRQQIGRMQGDPGIPQEWQKSDNALELATVDDSGQDAFVLRSATELRVYKFNDSHRLELLVTAMLSSFSGTDRLVFGNFLNAHSKDLLQFNSVGMTVYQRKQQTYVPLQIDGSFGELFGWNDDHVGTANVADIDGDGLMELWVSGPKGIECYKISHDKTEKISSLVDLSNEDRHASAILAIPALQSVIIDDGKKVFASVLLRGTIKQSNLPNISDLSDVDFPEPQPLLSLPTSPQVLSEAPLHEQLDITSFVQPINPLTGTLDFAVPLIQVGQSFGLSTTQSIVYRENQVQSTLGVGWSLPHDCIYVDRMGSIFSEDHQYYLLKDGSVSALISAKSTDPQVRTYKLDDDTKAEITFDVEQNQWKYIDQDEVLIYGSLDGEQYIKWELRSEHWPLALGNSKTSDKLLPAIWYVVKKQSSGLPNWMRYSYRGEKTSNLLLDGINTSDGGVLKLSYSDVNSQTLLTSYSVRTRSYNQNVQLQYKKHGSTIRLTSIQQAGAPVLQFRYNGPKQEMTEITYPSGLVSRFTYTLVDFHPNLLMTSIATHSRPKVAYGSGYMIVCDQTVYGQVRVQARDITGSETTEMSGYTFPLLGKQTVDDYQIFTGEAYFAVLLQHPRHYELCLFRTRSSREWQSDPKYIKLPKTATVINGRDFLLIRNAPNLTVVSLRQDGWVSEALSTTLTDDVLFRAFSHGYLTYDDRELQLSVHRNGTWIHRKLSFPAQAMADSAAVFDHFDHQATVLGNLKQGLKPDALQMYHNAIVFRSLSLENSRIYVVLRLMLLSNTHEVVGEETVRLLVEDLAQYTFDLPPMDENYFKIGYRLENGKYTIKVLQHTGKIMNEVQKIKDQIEQDIRDQPDAPEDEKARYRKESTEKLDQQVAEIHRNVTAQIPFAIDPAKFGVIVNVENIVTASHKVAYDGGKWSTERIPQEQLTLAKISLKLGKEFVLSKDGKEASFKLLKSDGSTVMDTFTADGNELVVSYPAYLAVQRNATAVRLFMFGTGKELELDMGDTVDPNSNSLALITVAKDERSVRVRSTKAFSQAHQSAIKQHELMDGDQRVRRVTHYQYNSDSVKPYGDGYLFSDVKVLPGDVPGVSGWYTERYSLQNFTTSTKSVYNSAGKFVRFLDKTVADSTDQPIDEDGMILAKDGRTVVLDYRPYEQRDEVVSYYGFEPYEVNRFGVNNRWTWNRNAEIKHDSGDSFLRLHRSSIEATFNPKINVSLMVISCWLRASSEVSLDRALTITINGQTTHGAVKRTLGQWRYVEALVENVSRFHVKVAHASAILDVDHLRVAPAALKFEANIYDHITGFKRAIVHSSGRLSHRILDLFGNMIGNVSEEGLIDYFLLRSRKGRSRVELKPAFGEFVQLSSSNVYRHKLKYSPKSAIVRLTYGYPCTFDVGIASSSFKITTSNDRGYLNVNNGQTQINVPREGELAVFATNNRYSVWMNGQLMIEKRTATTTLPNQLTITANNIAKVANVVLLYDPEIKVLYLTDLGMPIQEVLVKDFDHIAVQQIMYDTLDRPAIKTKWTEIDRSTSDHFFGFISTFVSNSTNVWNGDKMVGIVNDLNPECGGFPFYRTVYADDPLETKAIVGMPGKDFSVTGPFAKHHGSSPNIAFLENIFPADRGFQHHMERLPEQSISVLVYDKRKNKVADYVRTSRDDHHLTTYQYDQSNQLVLQLPPAYHEEADTFSRTEPFFDGTFSRAHLAMQRSWGIRYEYDTAGRIVSKAAPDAETITYLYTNQGLLRFMIQGNSTTYYTYASDGQLAEKGIVRLNHADLVSHLANDASLPIAVNFVLSDFGQNEVAPEHRHHVQKLQHVTQARVNTELLLFNSRDQLVSHTLLSSNHSMTMGYKYRNHRLYEIRYPALVNGSEFRVQYEHDQNGNIRHITNGSNKQVYATLSSNNLGSLQSITMEPDRPSAYRRTFRYNQPGYLTEISDPFITETIEYTTAGYGGRPVGDGTVQGTLFNATWHQFSNVNTLKLHPSAFHDKHSKRCFRALKNAGYLDHWNRPLKTFYPALELRLPLVCRTGTFANRIAHILSSRGFPQVYGHTYDYGSHKQLLKAKYFQNGQERSQTPLTPDAFIGVGKLSQRQSRDLWNALQAEDFIHTDCSNGYRCHGMSGKSLFHPTISEHAAAKALETFLSEVISAGKNPSHDAFVRQCQLWYDTQPQETMDATCGNIWSTLTSGNFVGATSNFSRNALHPRLRQLLTGKLDRHVPEIVAILQRSFGTALGQSAGDVQSYDIDPNGNHRHFYTGFGRYRLDYRPQTNQIAAVYKQDLRDPNLSEVRYEMKHNNHGSVTQAMHKGIQRIAYDPLFNRATEIELVSGATIKLGYDGRGERVLKRVYSRDGQLILEKYYIRDVKGKSLIEYDVRHPNALGTSVIRTTVYVYANDSLIGFIRNDQFYSVMLDHEGSIRLIIKDGEVVAAYDYLPYGELLRMYGEDPDAHIAYRYTGKEWDEETGLYNYHARLYDPEIGRFLQLDPKEQYASPYVYAGNSPVSIIDPDGQFAFLVVALVVGGAYLGASAANNSWNPTKWKLKPTLIGGILGGLVGGLAPGAAAASMTFLTATVGLSSGVAIGVLTTSAVGFAYISAAGANKNWDPTKWDWSSPGTWNGLFTGALTGTGVFGGIGKVHSQFLAYSGIHRVAFVVVTASSTFGVGIFSGAMANDGNFKFWEWDWKNPATVWGFVKGAEFGFSFSPNLKGMTKQLVERFKNLKSFKEVLQTGNLKQIYVFAKKEIVAWKDMVNEGVQEYKSSATNLVAPGISGVAIGVILLQSEIANITLNIAKSILDELPPLKILEEITEEIKQIEGIVDHYGRQKREMTSLALISVLDLPFHNATEPLLITSSSSKYSSWLNSLFEVFQNYRFTNPTLDTEESISSAIQPFIDRPPTTRYYELNNCYQRVDAELLTSHVVCYEWAGSSTIYPNASQATITEDHYSSCYPIEIDGHPSTVCHGSNSTYVFRPARRAVNVLDQVNASLMLLLVTPTAIKSVASFCRGLFFKSESHSAHSVPATSQEMQTLGEKLARTNQLCDRYRASVPKNDARWVDYVLQDLTSAIDDFVLDERRTRDQLLELDERLVELDNEIRESLEITALKTFQAYASDPNVSANNADFMNGNTFTAFSNLMHSSSVLESMSTGLL